MYWSQIHSQPYKKMSTCSHPRCHSGQQWPGKNIPHGAQWLLLLYKFTFKLAGRRKAQPGSQGGPDPALGVAPPLLHSIGHPRCLWAENRFQALVLLFGKTGKFTHSHGLTWVGGFWCQCQTIKVNCKKTAAWSAEILTYWIPCPICRIE